MAWKKLGRRNAAPVQSTELDLPSGCGPTLHEGISITGRGL